MLAFMLLLAFFLFFSSHMQIFCFTDIFNLIFSYSQIFTILYCDITFRIWWFSNYSLSFTKLVEVFIWNEWKRIVNFDYFLFFSLHFFFVSSLGLRFIFVFEFILPIFYSFLGWDMDSYNWFGSNWQLDMYWYHLGWV